MLSATARDGRVPLSDGDVARVRRAYRSCGRVLTDRRAATHADIAAAWSSWGKRLDVGGTRPGLLLRFIRDSAPA